MKAIEVMFPESCNVFVSLSYWQKCQSKV